MKKIIALILVAVMLFSMSATVSITTSGVSDDPADSYVPLIAANEDSDIQLWFAHSTQKVHQEDTTSNGRSTYSIHMAKNERQGVNAIFYTPVKKENLTATVTDFAAMDGSEATVSAKLFYEYYAQITGLNEMDVYGVTDISQSPYREGLIPDAIADLNRINSNTGKFALGAGKTQALYVRAETTSDTPAGWYSATLDLKDYTTGAVYKTAKIFLKVWNFEIADETDFQTAIYIENPSKLANDSTYKAYYDYLLENRLLGMNVPGELTSSNPYLTNPRVNAVRIGAPDNYLGTWETAKIKSVYQDLSSSAIWDDLKDKTYFYTKDEPTSPEQIAYYKKTYGIDWSFRPTVDSIIQENTRIQSAWPNANGMVPLNENSPYPYNTYSTTLAKNANGTYIYSDDGSGRFSNVKDAVQGLMDSNAIAIWCPKMTSFTPRSIILESGYKAYNENSVHVRNLNSMASGFNVNETLGSYFDWDSIYGTFPERFAEYKANCALQGKTAKLWWYSCGNNCDYTYCNHLLENTGLQTELLFWQAAQNDVEGYLYYSANAWTEWGTENLLDGTAGNYDGSITEDAWRCNTKTPDAVEYWNGDGVLFYGTAEKTKCKIASLKVIGTLRVEQMRDGIEDIEMLSMYKEAYGDAAMKQLISKVSSNVACYLSLPGFTRAAGYSSSMTNEDYFEAVRIELGNAVEESLNGPSTYTVTCDGVVVGEFEEGETVTLPVPALANPSKGKYNRFFTWNGNATVTRSKVASSNGTANGRKYTMTMPAEDVVLTSVTVLLGDADGNRRLAATDVLALRKHLSGGTKITDEKKLEAVDIDCNGRVAATDTAKCKTLISGTFAPTK